MTVDDVTLIEGDCLSILPTLPNASVDMILADLPYGTTNCAWDSVIPLQPLWVEYKRLVRPGGAIVLTASQPFTSALVMSEPSMFRYEMIWKKRRITGFLNAKRRPMSAHESVLIFGDAQTYNPQMRAGAMHKRNREERHDQNTEVYNGFRSTGLVWTEEYYPTSVIEFGADHDTTVTRRQRPDKEKRHPTQKPVALMRYLVRTYSNPGETILDNTMGHGTTGVAAVLEDRCFVGIELCHEYFVVAERRIRQAVRPGPLLPNNGFHLTAAPVGLWDVEPDSGAAAGEP